MTAVDPSAASPAQTPRATCPVGVLLCPFPNALTDLQQEVDHLIQQVRTDALTGPSGRPFWRPISTVRAAHQPADDRYRSL